METPHPDPRATDHRTSLGARGEELAAAHLSDAGLDVVARNWRLATGEVRGELDIVALDHDDGIVVVCEVKTRRGDRFGGPLLAVTPTKQAKIRALTVGLLTSADLPYRTVRFDVVGIRFRGSRPDIEHLAGAF